MAFFTNFCPIKIDLSGNTVWPQASGFQKLAKMNHFWHFWWTFVHSKCKGSSLRSPCWMRLFLWFSNTVFPQANIIVELLYLDCVRHEMTCPRSSSIFCEDKGEDYSRNVIAFLIRFYHYFWSRKHCVWKWRKQSDFSDAM